MFENEFWVNGNCLPYSKHHSGCEVVEQGVGCYGLENHRVHMKALRSLVLIADRVIVPVVVYEAICSQDSEIAFQFRFFIDQRYPLPAKIFPHRDSLRHDASWGEIQDHQQPRAPNEDWRCMLWWRRGIDLTRSLSVTSRNAWKVSESRVNKDPETQCSGSKDKICRPCVVSREYAWATCLSEQRSWFPQGNQKTGNYMAVGLSEPYYRGGLDHLDFGRVSYICTSGPYKEGGECGYSSNEICVIDSLWRPPWTCSLSIHNLRKYSILETRSKCDLSNALRDQAREVESKSTHPRNIL